MHRRIALAAAALSLVACTGPLTEVVRTTSMMKFNPSDRRAVWGRAVVSLNFRGALISQSDATAGVLRTEVQPGVTACSESHNLQAYYDNDPKVCRETRLAQFTMSDEGIAVLRMNRAVHGFVSTSRGHANFLTKAERDGMQKECDDLLRFIVGESKEMPAPASGPVVEDAPGEI